MSKLAVGSRGPELYRGALRVEHAEPLRKLGDIGTEQTRPSAPGSMLALSCHTVHVGEGTGPTYMAAKSETAPSVCPSIRSLYPCIVFPAWGDIIGYGVAKYQRCVHILSVCQRYCGRCPALRCHGSCAPPMGVAPNHTVHQPMTKAMAMVHMYTTVHKLDMQLQMPRA